MNSLRSHYTHLRQTVVGALALAVIVSGMIALRSASAARNALNSIPAFALALQNDQPQVGPGVPQVGSNAPKSAIGNGKAGSVLFFHRYTSDSANPSNVNTLVSLTNANPRDGVTLRLFFVRDCTVSSQFLNLAANQTRTLLMSVEDPDKTGYIVAVAVNSQGLPTQFNWLIGTASVRDAAGHEAAYNAVGVAKRTAGAAPSNEDSTTAEIKFNDADYDRLPQLIAIDNIQNQDPNVGPTPAPAVRTDVTVYSPLADLSAPGATALKITATAYDQSGRPFPTVIENSCGLNSPVSGVWTNPALNTFILPDNPGWGSFEATTAEDAPVPLLGLSLTDGVGAPHRSARHMQVLERLNEFTMKVPVSVPPDPANDRETADQPDPVGGALGASEMKAGSALIYPRFATGTHGESRIHITNTHPTQRTRVRVVFTGLADPTTTTETILNLFPNQTSTIDPAQLAPNQKGWVFALAIDSRALPLNFNHLIGSSQVREQGGGSAGYNALAVAKNSPGSVPRNDDAQSSDVVFNDEQYDRLPSTLALAALASQSDNTTTLGYARPPASLNDPVNTRGTVLATAYDDFLASFAATIGGIEVRVGNVRPNVLAPAITSTIQKGHRGWLKLTPGAPIFVWTNNTPTAPFVAQPGSQSWTGGFNGGLTPHILAVTDSYTLKTAATNPDNTAPVADFEPIEVYVEARSNRGTIVRLDGRISTDPNPDDQLTYRWFDNDTQISVAPVSDFLLDIGSHVIKLVVTDSSGLSSEKTTLVEVRDTTPPTLSGVPTNITKVTGSPAGVALNFPLPVAYDFGDGGFVNVTASKNPGSVFPIGRTLVTFKSRDNAGNENFATMEVNVTKGVATFPTQGGIARNRVPHMNNLNDQYVLVGKTKSIQLQAADGDGDPVIFTLQNAPAYATIGAIDPVARKATLSITPQQGDQVAATNVRVVATDNKGGMFSTLPFRIQISDVETDETGSGKGPNPGGGGGGGGGGGNNNPPVARMAPLASPVPATSRQGATFRLDGSQSSDPDGDPLSYVWKDNGVEIAEGAIVEVALPVGQHSITLTVSDDKGGVGVSDSQSVEVLPRPLSVISASPAKIPQFNAITMTITGTGFTEGTQVRFDCTSFCQGGSQITVTINNIEEDTITLTARTTQRTPLGNRDCVVTSPNGTSVRLSRSNFVSP
jgi:hypothetical protein